MKRRELGDDPCPIARSLDVIGDAWSLLILRDALLGKRRFGEFQASLGVARNILGARLRKLVSRGILRVKPASDGSAYREYVPTEGGQDLFVILMALRQWGQRHLFKGNPLKFTLVDRLHRKPVRPLELIAEDGRILSLADVIIEQARDVGTTPRAGGAPKNSARVPRDGHIPKGRKNKRR